MSTISVTKEALENLMKANEYSNCVIGTIYDEARAQKTTVTYGEYKSDCRYLETIVSVSFDPYDEDEDYYGCYNNDGSPIGEEEAREEAMREYKIYTLPKFESKLRVHTPDMYGDTLSFSTMDELWEALQTYNFVTIKNPPEVTSFI